MKQYLNSEQTAKLIELGFKKPKSEVKAEQVGDYAWFNPAYSIGELIEMLPGRVNGIDLTIDRYYAFEQWHVYYDASQYHEAQTELIYALFGMIVKLKEEGVI
jgi:hypothetical protein